LNFEGLADRKVYSVNRYFIIGHSLEHLCFAMVTFILTVMLSFRNINHMIKCYGTSVMLH
jgi:hypothetical protein